MMLATPTIGQYLDDSALRLAAPSIFADAAHESRSSRYLHIPTIRVVDGLRSNGFFPVKVASARVRDDSRNGFQKHMIRFRPEGSIARAVGDIFPEVVLVNSHDGSSSYQLSAGLFRLVCKNGMVVSEGSHECLRLKHSGNIVDDVIDGSFRVLAESQKAIEVAGRWNQLQLTGPEQNAVAIAAHHIRFADAEGNIDTPITPAQLLTPRRGTDNRSDLWTTFNRVQENVIKGGLHAYERTPEGRRRRVSTREVKGIDGNVNLNKALWKLAEALAAAKSAA